MKKFQSRAIIGIVILTMLATAPLSISYTFADSSGQESEQKIAKSTKQNELGAILTEKVVDGELQVKRFALSEKWSEDDKNRMIFFNGETSGWAYIKHNAYQSGIILFDGKASKVGKNLWEISTQGTIKIDDKTLDLEGKSNGSRIFMHGTAISEELSYRVIFSGKMVEAGNETFAVMFTNSGLKNPESGQIIKLDQIGELVIDSQGIDSNQGFGKAKWVG